MTEKKVESLRSQGTRDRILAAAKSSFAGQGFERTTIRGIAEAAQIHPSLVMRYYGSKEDLFAAAAQIDLRIPELSDLPSSTRGAALVRHVLDRWEGAASEEFQALLRAAGTHPAARQRITELVQTQAVPVLRRALSGEDVEGRLGLIIIQVTGLVLSRHFLRHPAVMALDREKLIERMGQTLQDYLDG